MTVALLEVLFWCAAAIVVYAYFGYALLIVGLARWHPAPPVQKKPWTPLLSVIIAARDEEAHLETKLLSCLALDYPREQLEILVVSDGSRDRTEEIARGFADRGVVLMTLPEARGKASALNAAAARARGEVLLLTDARQHLDAAAARELVENLADPAVGAVSGELHLAASGLGATEGVGLYWRFEKLLRRCESRFDSTVGVTGALYAVRRELFPELDERTILDDVAVPMSVALAGHRVVFEPGARAWDRLDDDPRLEYRRKVRTLAGNLQLLRLEPRLLSHRNRLVGQFISHKLLRLVVPWCLLVLLGTSASLSASGSPFYLAAFGVQLGFYVLAVLGGLQARRGRALGPLSTPYAFALLNLAAAQAFLVFLRGDEHATWREAAADGSTSLPRDALAQGEKRRRRVAFVLSKFPCYDEAFLTREIHALSQRLDVLIFSLRRSNESVVHDEARPLVPLTVAPPYLLSMRVLAAHLRVLRRRPLRYLRALADTLSGNWTSPEFLLKNLLFFPKAVYLGEWALDNRIDHIHAGWATYPASAAMVASTVSGLPFSFSGHAHDIYLQTAHLAEKIRRSVFVTTCTESNGRYLQDLVPSCPSDRIEVVRHGLNLERFATPSPSLAPFEILSVGTLNPHKGFAQLLSALALLREDGLDCHCTIVGSGPLQAQLLRQRQELGLVDHVTMTGALIQAQVVPYYLRAAAFVLMAQPEWHWGVPNVIIEALAARVAVVTTRFGSVEELIRDGETGLLVPPRDPSRLAATLRELADDSGLRRRLAEAGHDVVAREYDLRRTIAAYLRRFGSAEAAEALPQRPAFEARQWG